MPAIVLSAGRCSTDGTKASVAGSGTVVWKAREQLAGRDRLRGVHDIWRRRRPGRPLQHHGTASTMNSLARPLGHVRSAAPRSPPLRDGAARSAYETASHVGMVWRSEAVRHPDAKGIRKCIVVNSAIGGSTNAPIHINALARISDVELDIDDWQKFGHEIRYW